MSQVCQRARVALVVLCGALAVAAASARAGIDARRARLAYQALQRVYFDPRSGDYRETPGGPAASQAWPFSQALAATIALAELTGARSPAARAVPARLRELDRRFASRGVYRAAPGAPVYWDDNEWIAEDLLSWNAFRPSPSSRRKAVRIFAALADAWDDDPQKPCPGGVQWTDAPGNDDRNTVSTANGAVVALRLYLLTRRPGYLAWAQRMIGWVEQCLHGPDGLYWDHLAGDGSVDETEWSYNQGSMLEAYRLLYAATGDPSDLARAVAIADATLAAFRGRWSHEPPAFAAIFFRRLLALAGVARRSDYVTAAQRYADALWKARPRQLFAQAALVQLYARLALTAVAPAPPAAAPAPGGPLRAGSVGSSSTGPPSGP
ncbi:MAG TPA: glycoside hydrolase family 76 protein [Gaiellaceae bacterium]|nr:glycoside hydrolase family 76 protein [Gaiellaceae bacterium]